MVVADIGTGSGVLAREAIRAGAAQVYAIEKAGGIIPFAQRINETLGMDTQIDILRGDSREITLPEEADVVLCELIGGVGNDEAISSIMEDARTRHLKPGGVVIPSRIEVFMCPVECPCAHGQIPVAYDADPIALQEDAPPPFRAYYGVLGLTTEHLISSPETLDRIDLTAHTEAQYERQFCFNMKRAAVLSGFAVWFVARLTNDISLDTSPWAPSTCWGQAFFPIQDQPRVQAEDSLSLRFQSSVSQPGGFPVYSWKGAIVRGTSEVTSFSETNAPAAPAPS